jgi:excisionase family DNA binding protein
VLRNARKGASLTKQLKGAAALAALEKDGRLFATPAEAAVILRRDVRTIYAGLERGEIPNTRVGQRFQIPVAWLRRQADGPSEPAGDAR